MKKIFSKKGYSLIEALVAIAILMIAIVGPLTVAAKSIQTSLYARQQIAAYFFAQEGVSLVESIRDDYGLQYVNNPSSDPWSWTSNANLTSCFDSDGCNLDVRDASIISNVSDCTTIANCVIKFNSSPTPKYKNSGTASAFTRVITLKKVTADEVNVIVTVSWSSHLLSSTPGNTEQVVLETSLFNIYK